MPQPDPEAEFDMALARAGVVVPPERRAAILVVLEQIKTGAGR